MFSASSRSAPRALPTIASPAVAPPSIVSHDVTITGTLESDGDIQIDGRVEGDVRCARLVVGESGVIHGDIRAGTVTVRGCVNGSLSVRILSLTATARVEGDILHQSLAVETGAFIQGRFRHAMDPLAEIPPDAADRRHINSPMRANEERKMTQTEPLRAAG